jgi:hypothetical protein
MAMAGLDVIEKIDRFVEEPEGTKAGDVEDRNHEGSSHKSQEERVNDWVCQP